MNRLGYKCRPCRHGKTGNCKGSSYRSHGCATNKPKPGAR